MKLDKSFKNLQKDLRNLTDARNEFAHEDMKRLIKKYNHESEEGTKNIIKLYQSMHKLFNGMLDIVNNTVAYKDYQKYLDTLLKAIEKATGKKESLHTKV